MSKLKIQDIKHLNAVHDCNLTGGFEYDQSFSYYTKFEDNAGYFQYKAEIGKEAKLQGSYKNGKLSASTKLAYADYAAWGAGKPKVSGFISLGL
jgi:hypothetical protein